MTYEEAIEVLKNDIEICTIQQGQACEMAIKALEQQPCEDAVSREQVEEITFQEPSYTDPYNILTEVREKVRALPSVTPERPKGKWMECGGDEPWLKGYCCSLCNFTTTQKYDYCTCGAEMVGGEEDEVDN